jgi:hypothetical protein
MSVSLDDCPCCQEFARSPDDFDRALVVAFIGGMMVGAERCALHTAICRKHHAMVQEATTFVAGALAGKMPWQ